MTLQSDSGHLRRTILVHPRDAFAGQGTGAATWGELGYLAEPDLPAACAEMDHFASLLARLGVEVAWSEEPGLGLDSIYVRDASVVSDRGVVLCRMGKAARRAEPDAVARTYERLGVPVLGRIESPGTLEGGDVAWIAPGVLAVGRGYRTNDEGIRQLRALLGAEVEVITVPLPHWKGSSDVFHLMSMLSPVADDLAVVYSPLLPVSFRETLLERGIGLVEVPDTEFDSMACNVLAVAPRVVVALEGNPVTRRRMEAVGIEVHAYAGKEISTKGSGGPTCLTRPLERVSSDS